MRLWCGVLLRGHLLLRRILQRLGITSLGALTQIPATQIADRFGTAGLRARHLAAGGDEPLNPRRPPEQLE